MNGDAPVVVRIGPPGAGADLEAALEGLDPVRCAVVRVGNPLKAPLTPQRVMLQLAPLDEGGNEGGPKRAGGDEAGRLLRTVADRAAGRPSLLVVVEQAETLTPAALALLQLLPGLRGAGIPSVRVAFYGTPAFRALLDDGPVRPVQDPAAAPAPSALLPPRQMQGRRRRGAVLGIAAVAVPVLVAALLVFRGVSPVAGVPAAPASPSLPPAPTAPATAPATASPAVVPPPDVVPQPQAATTAPSAPPPSAPPPSATVESPVAARARLFREFNAFVEARGLAGRLSRSEREALFEEYLVRRSVAAGPMVPAPVAPAPSTPASAAAAASDAASLPASAPEVVLFVRDGRPNAEARAGESAALLRRWVTEVTVRSATDGPAEPTVRYFRPEDRSLALTLAFALPSMTPDWQLVDLSGAADRPVRPTIEVWLPPTP